MTLEETAEVYASQRGPPRPGQSLMYCSGVLDGSGELQREVDTMIRWNPARWSGCPIARSVGSSSEQTASGSQRPAAQTSTEHHRRPADDAGVGISIICPGVSPGTRG
ncbi:MAG TPA: hypothetical protein K8V32_13155 [Enteractinococcus helveticum]|uniref:Uncharacterized protein n=1 Tax=Enteractinococcus helveticum TaxID=1837282 RepID=A0A921FQ71_9MICC|nr:hypothetical protein [Enteractinococcus helveticum]HJF15719.1 hypothetical protein [Enteractinococcus helveticum]